MTVTLSADLDRPQAWVDPWDGYRFPQAARAGRLAWE
jgi:hypothetical protein